MFGTGLMEQSGKPIHQQHQISCKADQDWLA